MAAIRCAIFQVIAAVTLGDNRLVARRHGIGLYPSFQSEAFGAVGIQLLVSRHKDRGLRGQSAVASFAERFFHIHDLRGAHQASLGILQLAVIHILRETGQDRLIHPVPNKAALHIYIVADFFPILIKASQRVAHGMRIFRPDIRNLIIRILCIASCASLCRILHAINVYQTLLTVICIHRVFRINVIALVVALVFSNTAGIALQDPIGGNTETVIITVRSGASICSLIAQRPDHNGRMIL